MKKTITLLLITILTSLFWGCLENSSSDKDQARKTEKLMLEANAQAGMPAIKNFQEKKIMKMLYEIRDQENLKTYVYLKSDYNGKLIFLGTAIGYGLPASVQYSNPQKVRRIYSGTYISMPQPEPNGLFMPEGLSATYILMIDPKTKKPRPVYIEPEIVVSPFPLN